LLAKICPAFLGHWQRRERIPLQFIQAGYGYPGFTPQLKEFSDPNGMQAIRELTAGEYYDNDFFPGDHDLTLPDSAEKYLDRVFSLVPENAKQFDIASTWLSQANALWSQSSSAALMALVSAIEALLQKTHETCKECGQSKFEITKKFKTFLKQHVSGIEDNFPEEYKAIYTTRSGLAHGGDLLVADLEPWNYFGTPLQQWQDDFQRNTGHIVATALRNWVFSL
jgi:hypothetical protein